MASTNGIGIVQGAVPAVNPLGGLETLDLALGGPVHGKATTQQVGALAFSNNPYVNGGTINVTPTTNPLIINANSGSPPAALPGTAIQVVGPDGGAVRCEVDAFGGSAQFVGRAAGGTQAAPTALVSGASIAQFSGMGFDGTAYAASGSSININAAENYTPTAHGTSISFRTVNTGSVALSTKMVIGNYVLVGTTVASGTNNLQVSGGLSVDNVVVSGATLSITGLGTIDPHVVGRAWLNSNVLTISGG
jgi:hypothetical protein